MPCPGTGLAPLRHVSKMKGALANVSGLDQSPVDARSSQFEEAICPRLRLHPCFDKSRTDRRARFRAGNSKRGLGMSNQWQYQVRIYLPDDLAEVARSDPGNPALGPLAAVLAKHGAVLKCQFDVFAGYVAEAERHGVSGDTLYKWTKATIEDPVKKAKYITSFMLYVDGTEVYSKERADALEADLQPLVHSKVITRISKHDTNPANTPQPPAQYRS